jgi:hypothetical protein
MCAVTNKKGEQKKKNHKSPCVGSQTEKALQNKIVLHENIILNIFCNHDNLIVFGTMLDANNR